MTWPERDEELMLARRMLGGISTGASAGNDVQPRDAARRVWGATPGIGHHFCFGRSCLSILVDVVRHTRTHESVSLGAGPRATQAVTAGQPRFSDLRRPRFCQSRRYSRPWRARSWSTASFCGPKLRWRVCGWLKWSREFCAKASPQMTVPSHRALWLWGVLGRIPLCSPPLCSYFRQSGHC